MRLVVGAAVVGVSLLAVAAMRLSPLFAALLLCLALLPTRAADGTATTLDDCLAAGDVWLLVIDDADADDAWDYSDSGAHGYRPPQRPLRRPRRPLRNNAPRVSAQRMSGALG